MDFSALTSPVMLIALAVLLIMAILAVLTFILLQRRSPKKPTTRTPAYPSSPNVNLPPERARTEISPRPVPPQRPANQQYVPQAKTELSAPTEVAMRRPPMPPPGYGAPNSPAASLYGGIPTSQLPPSPPGTAPASPFNAAPGPLGAPNPYGGQSAQNPYGGAPAQNPYGSAPAQNPYGGAPAQNPYGGQSAQNPYGGAPAQNPYGNPPATPASNPYGSPPAPNPYGSPAPAAPPPNPYSNPPASPFNVAPGTPPTPTPGGPASLGGASAPPAGPYGAGPQVPPAGAGVNLPGPTSQQGQGGDRFSGLSAGSGSASPFPAPASPEVARTVIPPAPTPSARVETPQAAPPPLETPKIEPPSAESTRTIVPGTMARPTPEIPRTVIPPSPMPPVESPKVEPSAAEPPRVESPKVEPPAAMPAGGTIIIPRSGPIPQPGPHLLARGSNNRFDLRGERSLIGKDSDNDVQFEDDSLSGKHAVIVRRDGTFHIQDTGSQGGTYLNGERVQGRQPLKSGDVLRFGTVEMTFHA